MIQWLQRHRLPAVAALTLSLTVAILAASSPMASAQESAASPAAADTAKATKPSSKEARKAARAEEKAASKARKEAKKADKAAIKAKQDAADQAANLPWQDGANWLSLRAGYAKSAADEHGNGDIGAGAGYYHFLNRRWAAAIQMNVDVLGRFQGATELSIPLTLEFTRHIQWPTEMRPYIGMGGGAFYYSTYRTGDDYAMVRPGVYLTGGFNTPISERSLVGIDLRAQWSFDATSDNPVFPDDGPNVLHWSLKLNYLRWQ